MKEVLYLYSTSACHLCDQALQVIDSVLNPEYFEKTVIDIAESDALIEQYGTRIPVLRIPSTGDELGWPFDERMLMEFIDKALF